MSLGQYLQDTRAELRHVAWPTRVQTIVYTIFVALISVGIALYLGLFDFLFTGGLSRLLTVLPAQNPITITQSSTSSNPLIITPTPVATTTTQ